MDIKETVIALSEVSGTSGSEENAAELALSMLREFAPDAAVVNGNVIGRFGVHKDGLPSLVLDAHIDQIGFVVTYITDEGFVKVGNVGGIDRRLLPAQPHRRAGERGLLLHLRQYRGHGPGRFPAQLRRVRGRHLCGLPLF